uniref:VPS35 endosomal protein-sorting factor-like n=1 Tax=Styela clava TaxID=7725 RepID=UPI001939DCDA|nr:VPS35 endosomal protein-sorting factor-like [Styela clava]
MQKAEYAWIPKKVDYELIDGKKNFRSRPVAFSEYHPLKPITVTESAGVKASSKRRKSDASSTKSGAESVKSSSGSTRSSSSATKDFIDPLSAMAIIDPLSVATQSTPKNSEQVESSEADILEVSTNDEYGEGFEHWASKKLFILSNYTLDEKLSMQMISISKSGDKAVGRSFNSSSTTERLQIRLNQLNDMEEGSVQELKTQSQQNFIDRMYDLGKNLRQSWESNQKVNALKIAIQCAKMLSDVSVMQFYPSKFVLIADILQTFGQLVYGRILSMCAGMSADKIDLDKVSDNAKEICLNWMMKIASIRELLPRILIEASILPCYNFLKKDECNSALVRLTNMAKGVGNPLVCVYVRTYLCMIGVKYTPKFKGHLLSNFYYFISTYKQIHTTSVQNEIAHQKLDMSTYLSLYMPALEWILSCIAHNAHESTLKDVLEKCAKTGNSLLILRCILASFKPDYVSARALDFSSIISQSDDSLFPKDVVFTTLGNSVIECDPPEKDKQPLLADVWKYIVKLQDPSEYIACAAVWTEYAVKNFKKKEVNTILGDILKHMVPDRAFEKHYSKLQDVVKRILTHMKSFSVVFAIERFLPFLDMFQKDDVKLDICTCVAEFFIKGSDQSTSDPLVINGMMYICRAMHDSINSMSLESERRSVGNAICAVIQKITFGRDFEQQLNFYVECRGSFRNLDSVLSALVHLVNTLSTTCTRIVKHKHTTKTASFVRACAAFCFITIPSLSDVYARLQLYLVSGQAALISHCVTQADAMFCAAVTQILDAPSLIANTDGKNVSTQNIMASYITNFLSTLLTVPDHPEQGILYLLRGLMNVISATGASGGLLSMESRISVYIKVLSLLSAYSQDRYLYRVEYVDSNEHLYSSDEKFLAEISSIGTTLLDELFAFLTASSQYKSNDRAAVASELFSTIIAFGNIEAPCMQKLAVTTWNLMIKTGGIDHKQLVKTISHVKGKGGSYTKVASSLSLSSKV